MLFCLNHHYNANLRYIEIIVPFKMFEIIEYIKWISHAYGILAVGVKQK